jgi:S-adenosylmethionine synthetase
LPALAKAQCLLISQIGAPVTHPAMLQLKLASRKNILPDRLRPRIEEIAADRPESIPRLIDDFIAGGIDVF